MIEDPTVKLIFSEKGNQEIIILYLIIHILQLVTAVLRELKEETGISLNQAEIKERILGLYEVRQLALFQMYCNASNKRRDAQGPFNKYVETEGLGADVHVIRDKSLRKFGEEGVGQDLPVTESFFHYLTFISNSQTKHVVHSLKVP